MPHLLTDEIIEEIWDTTGPCDPAYFGERHPSPEEMRAVADWQLEQVIEQWEKVNDSNKTDIQVIREFDKRLKAMRPQEDN